MNKVIPIIIPSFEPDSRLCDVVHSISKMTQDPIVIVNDGSADSYLQYYEKCKDLGAVVLSHEENKGKGRALKTAFKYCLDNIANLGGVVTADSDGQHTPSDILSVVSMLRQMDDACLILGTRDFEKENIPEKSRFGNNLTKKVFRVFFRKEISDTQTGLRGIHKDLMHHYIGIKGDRFEYETNMLLDAINRKTQIIEIPIETIYDDKLNHSTHFRPIVDSVKIYYALGSKFFKFIFSSLSASVVDICLFQILCFSLRNAVIPWINYIVISAILARVMSGIYNYLLNYKFVFKSNANIGISAVKYLLLFLFIMICSSLLTYILAIKVNVSLEMVVKIPVDISLFFLSYYVQKKFIF